MKILGEVQSVVGFALGAAVAFAHGAGEPPLELFATIPMPGVKGRIDHFAIDVKRHRLFVAALEKTPWKCWMSSAIGMRRASRASANRKG